MSYLTFESFATSDIGHRRDNNEDAWLSLPDLGFFALADGMGGHKAGEVASRHTLELLHEAVEALSTQDPTELLIELRYAIEMANEQLQTLGKKNKEWRGMGTTLCCLLWKGPYVLYAHVGDSRIYRLRDKTLTLLTEDHSFWTKWRRAHPHTPPSTPYRYKNVITRSVGGPGKALPDVHYTTSAPGDLFLLCSDGISDPLSSEEIEAILSQDLPLSLLGENVLQAAKKKKGFDNMTLVLCKTS